MQNCNSTILFRSTIFRFFRQTEHQNLQKEATSWLLRRLWTQFLELNTLTRSSVQLFTPTNRIGKYNNFLFHENMKISKPWLAKPFLLTSVHRGKVLYAAAKLLQLPSLHLKRPPTPLCVSGCM